MSKERGKTGPLVIGWAEDVALPDLGIAHIRAKIDTGARTSALHATRQEEFLRDGRPWVRFHIAVPGTPRTTRVEAPLVDQRDIKNTSGVAETRRVILTTLRLGARRWQIEVSLADRANMGFDLILGRTALRRRRILVDPGRSRLAGPPSASRASAPGRSDAQRNSGETT